MVPWVSTSNLLIPIYNNMLNSKGAIASPCLKPVLTLNSKYKCLPVLTLASISLLKILHNLTIFWGKPSLCISLYISFLRTGSHAAWKSVNNWCTSIFCSQHFSNICLIVKAFSTDIFPFESLLGILLLFSQHRILIVHIKYMPEICMLDITVWLLYNYLSSSRSLPYEMDTLCHISAHVVWYLPPTFFKRIHRWSSSALFFHL